MNAFIIRGESQCDVYGWDVFVVPALQSPKSLGVPSFEGYVVPGEFILLFDPIIHNNIAYDYARVINIDHSVYVFIQLASNSNNILVPQLTPPSDRSYVYYPPEIVLTNIGTCITVTKIKSIAMVVTTTEVEDTIWGQLASVKNIYLIRFQYHTQLDLLSAAAKQPNFIYQSYNSYTLQIRILLMKIISTMKQLLNGGAINRPLMESELLCISVPEWKYIYSNLRIPVQEVTSMESSDITRDRATREMLKKNT